MTGRTQDVPLKVGTTGFVALTDDEGALVPAQLVYQPRDCLAVSLVLLGPDGLEVTWTFAWELLALGLLAPVGDGDITVGPGPGPLTGVEVTLAAPATARLWLPGADVAGFVRQVRARTPVDTRAIASALDKELSAITSGT